MDKKITPQNLKGSFHQAYDSQKGIVMIERQKISIASTRSERHSEQEYSDTVFNMSSLRALIQMRYDEDRGWNSFPWLIVWRHSRNGVVTSISA